MSQVTNDKKSITLTITGLVLLSALGFVLRYIYLQRMIIHTDEFISLLGIKMALDKGIPIYPSQVFEGKGIIFSYLGAGVSTIFSFSVETIRYLTLVSSVLTIPLVYWTAYKLFNRKWVAFLAALLTTIHPMAIVWGVRARMYSMAAFFVFLLILVSWLSLSWYNTKRSYLFWVPLVVLIALLTHLVVIINLPALLLALVISHWFLNKPKINQPKDWLGLGLVTAGIIVATGIGSLIGRQPGEIRQWQAEASLLTDIANALLRFGLLQNIYLSFLTPENLVATLFALLGIFGLVRKARHRELEQTDFAAIFIYIQLITTFIIVYVFVPSNVRDSRHDFMVLLPFLLLAAAYGVLVISQFVQKVMNGSQLVTPMFYSIVMIGLVVQQGPTINALLFGENPETYRYDLALNVIKEQMLPEDKHLAVLTPAPYLFDVPADFYANQHKPRFYQDPTTNQLIDYYTGGVYLPSVEDFYTAIDEPGRLWFAIDTRRLTRNYDPRFSQEILHQMRLFDQVDNVMIFVERDEHWAMADKPEFQMTTDFLDQAHLAGYTTHLVGTDLQLTFFWKAQKPLFNYKMFVHLRDQQGNTVAQADFSPYDHVVHMKNWQKMWDDELIRTGTVLYLPPELLNSNPDQYRLYVGLYAPQFNAQRVPVTNDVTGENAVILTDLGL